MPVLGLGAGPAGAAIDSGTASITFHSGGAEVTCTIEGSSSVSYVSRTNRSFMNASTRLASGSDPECEPLLLHISVTGSYRVEGRTGEDFFQATSGETSAIARAGVTGVVVELEGFHTAEFDCDEGPKRCVAQLLTSAK